MDGFQILLLYTNRDRDDGIPALMIHVYLYQSLTRSSDASHPLSSCQFQCSPLICRRSARLNCGHGLVLSHMTEDLRNQWRVYHAGDDPQCSITIGADLVGDGEHTLEALHLRHWLRMSRAAMGRKSYIQLPLWQGATSTQSIRSDTIITVNVFGPTNCFWY
jgi:hypothetical protein